MADTQEVVIARIDERVNSLANLIEQMAENHKDLTNSYQKLVENNERIAVLENEMKAMKDSLKTLWNKFDENERQGKKFAGHAAFEIGKLIVAAGIGALLSKLGINIAT